MRNSPGLVRMGAIGTVEIGTKGTVETGTEGMAETGAVGIIETGAMGVAGTTAKSIPTSAANPSPSKVLQSTKIGIQIKGDCYKGEMQVHTCKEEMTKKRERINLANTKEGREKGTYL